MFLLDTNVLSEMVRRQPHPNVSARFEAAADHELFTSAVCVEEVRYGCGLVPHGEDKWRKVHAKVLSRVTVLDFDYATAVRAGELRAAWKQAGTPCRLRRRPDRRSGAYRQPHTRHPEHPALRSRCRIEGRKLVRVSIDSRIFVLPPSTDLHAVRQSPRRQRDREKLQQLAPAPQMDLFAQS